MTSTIHAEVERTRKRRDRRPTSFLEAFASGLREQLERTTALRWPSDRYRRDPVAFFREILGVEPWHKQIEIIEAIRDHPRVAVKAGHKVSKSHTIGGAALWFYCSFDDAQAVLTYLLAEPRPDELMAAVEPRRFPGGSNGSSSGEVPARGVASRRGRDWKALPGIGSGDRDRVRA